MPDERFWFWCLADDLAIFESGAASRQSAGISQSLRGHHVVTAVTRRCRSGRAGGSVGI